MKDKLGFMSFLCLFISNNALKVGGVNLLHIHFHK